MPLYTCGAGKINKYLRIKWHNYKTVYASLIGAIVMYYSMKTDEPNSMKQIDQGGDQNHAWKFTPENSRFK